MNEHKIHNHKVSNQHTYAYIDKTGKVAIVLPDYDAIGSFSEGLAAVWLEQKGWGFIDKSGNLKIQPQFEKMLDFSDGLAGIKIDGMWGFIDKSGTIVIKPQYERVNQFSEGVAVVVRGTSTHPSQPPVPGQRRTVTEVRSYPLTATSDGNDTTNANRLGGKEVFVIDKTGHAILSRHLNEAVQIKYDEDARFSEGLLEAFDGKTERYGFVDKTGKFVIGPKYDQVSRFSEGLARVAIFEAGEERIGFIDRTGRFVIQPKFNTDADFGNSSDFSEGLAALTEGLNPTITEQEKIAYINKSGGIELLTDFREAYSFREGLALVNDEKNDKWGFIDKSGKIVIAPQFSFAREFSEGLAAVTLDPRLSGANR
jgi:hypothetical protein